MSSCLKLWSVTFTVGDVPLWFRRQLSLVLVLPHLVPIIQVLVDQNNGGDIPAPRLPHAAKYDCRLARRHRAQPGLDRPLAPHVHRTG